MSKQVNTEDLALLGELGIDTATKQQAARTPREQRIIAGYEEIARFVEQHGRLPEHGETRDIVERLYAVRLNRLRHSPECREVLKGIDAKRLLDIQEDVDVTSVNEDATTDEALLQALGAAHDAADEITQLKYVRSSQEKMAAEEIAQRTPCQNFGVFKPLFQQLQRDLETGFRKTLKYQDNGEINKGDFFVVEGQKAYVADWGDPFISSYNKPDRRLRVIYDNGTESDLLLRSMQRALNRDPASRRITDPTLGPLFSNQSEAGDQNVGYIYVLRSRSDNAFIAENRKVIHKLGITQGSVQQRVANAAKDPTYLLAEVEIVETYQVANLDLKRLEKLLHKFFDPARLDLQLKDRFGFDVEPREWFLLPLPIIEEAIQKLIDGTLPKHQYNPAEGRIAFTD